MIHNGLCGCSIAGTTLTVKANAWRIAGVTPASKRLLKNLRVQLF